MNADPRGAPTSTSFLDVVDVALARVGRAIYPARGAFGVPFLVLVLVLCRPTPYAAAWGEAARILMGWSVLVLGLAVRTWGVACWFTRDADGVIGGRRLMVSDGPYAYVRNPRYLGNLLMGTGVAILAGIPHAVGLFALLWCLVHVPVMAAERLSLSLRYGDAYDGYCARVPMFVPRYDPSCPLFAQVLGLNWTAGTREEIGTLMGWLSLGLFVEAWRAAHLGGAVWLSLALIPLVVVACESLRARLPRESFADGDRPVAP